MLNGESRGVEGISFLFFKINCVLITKIGEKKNDGNNNYFDFCDFEKETKRPLVGGGSAVLYASSPEFQKER